MTSLHKSKPAELRAIMSEALLKDVEDDFDSFFANASSSITTSQFNQLDAAYHIQEDTSKGIILHFDTTSENAYTIRYKAITTESFVSLLVPNREGDRYVMACLFGKYAEDWRLNAIQYGRMEIYDKTAPQHYLKAQEEYESGLALKALSRMAVAQSISSPSNQLWDYYLAPEMQAFGQELIGLVSEQYELPMEVEQIPTTPLVFSVAPELFQGQICHMVKYRTTINMQDSIALDVENSALHDEVMNTFEGIDSDADYIFYRAFNEIPQKDVATPYYGFVRETKEETELR